MRHPFVITLICASGLLACGGKTRQEKRNDRCEAARDSAVTAWTSAAKGWGKVHDRWADATLAGHVRTKLLADAKEKPETVDVTKLPATMERFDEFVQFKLRLSERARLGAESAAKHARAEVAIALQAAEKATDKMFDLSGVRPEQPVWNRVKQVDDAERAMEHAKAGSTNAHNRTRAIQKACPK